MSLCASEIPGDIPDRASIQRQGSRVQAPLPLELWELIIEQCSLLELDHLRAQSLHDDDTQSLEDIVSLSYPSDYAQKIYDLIIHRRKILLACALTCSSWLTTSLRCLYRSIIISDYGLLHQKYNTLMAYKNRSGDNPSRDQSFDLLMATRDALGSIRTRPFHGLVPLRIRILFSDQSSYSQSSTSFGSKANNNSLLTSLFPELDGTAFSLQESSRSTKQHSSSIHITDERWRAHLCVRAIQDLHLHLIMFQSFPSLVHTLQSFPSLRRLFMDNISLADSKSDTHLRVPQNEENDLCGNPQFKLSVFHCHLHIDVMYLALKWMTDHDVFSGTLVDLKIYDYGTWLSDEETTKYHKEIASWIPTITKSSGARLKRVDVRCVFEDKNSLQLLDLRTNKFLEKLIIHNITSPAATSILSTTPSTCLTLIEIHYITISTLTDLDDLIDTLVHPRFSSPLSLQKLSLYVYAPSDFETEREDWKGQAEKMIEILGIRERRLKAVYGERLKWSLTL